MSTAHFCCLLSCVFLLYLSFATILNSRTVMAGSVKRHLQHLAADSLSLLIRPDDSILMDETRRTQTLHILRRLCGSEFKSCQKMRHNHWIRFPKQCTQIHRHVHTPFDALKSAAGHVNDAPCWSSQSSNQAFAHTLKETRRSFLLSSYRNTHTLMTCLLSWTHR